MGVRASRLSKLVGAGGSSLTPRGYIPVSVGASDDTTRRFIVHTTALGEAEFLELLYRSAEEYGFYNDGVLRIPYEAKDFEAWVINRRASKRKIFKVEPIV